TNHSALLATVDVASEQHDVITTPLDSARKYPEVVFKLFVAGVIGVGIAIASIGFIAGKPPDYAVIGLLTGLAIAAELLQLNLYGENTISVSVAIAFAAAAIADIPGVVCVSAGIALAHYIQRRPALYKTAFNWATHVVAGLAPALAVGLPDVPLQVSNV